MALPFQRDANGVAYYDNKDANNVYAMPTEQWIRNASNIFVPINTTTPLPVNQAGSAWYANDSISVTSTDASVTVNVTRMFTLIANTGSKTVVINFDHATGVADGAGGDITLEVGGVIQNFPIACTALHYKCVTGGDTSTLEVIGV